jgi:hypothetical protein
MGKWDELANTVPSTMELLHIVKDLLKIRDTIVESKSSGTNYALAMVNNNSSMIIIYSLMTLSAIFVMTTLLKTGPGISLRQFLATTLKFVAN